jgi:hypothetical protein
MEEVENMLRIQVVEVQESVTIIRIVENSVSSQVEIGLGIRHINKQMSPKIPLITLLPGMALLGVVAYDLIQDKSSWIDLAIIIFVLVFSTTVALIVSSLLRIQQNDNLLAARMFIKRQIHERPEWIIEQALVPFYKPKNTQATHKLQGYLEQMKQKKLNHECQSYLSELNTIIVT